MYALGVKGRGDRFFPSIVGCFSTDFASALWDVSLIIEDGEIQFPVPNTLAKCINLSNIYWSEEAIFKWCDTDGWMHLCWFASALRDVLSIRGGGLPFSVWNLRRCALAYITSVAVKGPIFNLMSILMIRQRRPSFQFDISLLISFRRCETYHKQGVKGYHTWSLAPPMMWINLCTVQSERSNFHNRWKSYHVNVCKDIISTILV